MAVTPLPPSVPSRPVSFTGPSVGRESASHAFSCMLMLSSFFLLPFFYTCIAAQPLAAGAVEEAEVMRARASASSLAPPPAHPTAFTATSVGKNKPPLKKGVWQRYICVQTVLKHLPMCINELMVP